MNLFNDLNFISQAKMMLLSLINLNYLHYNVLFIISNYIINSENSITIIPYFVYHYFNFILYFLNL